MIASETALEIQSGPALGTAWEIEWVTTSATVKETRWVTVLVTALGIQSGLVSGT